ncbi:MAG: McrB family protein [Bacillota bacterium]
MAIPKNISKDDILKAFKYIDANGVPEIHKSTKYELIDEQGKKYPPKYVIAVANHLANNEDISTEGFDASEAKEFLERLNFVIETKQEKFELVITANEVTSTDDRFTMDNLGLGDYYKPLDTYFKSASGAIIRRKHNYGEKRVANQTLPRLAFQIFEQYIDALTDEEKESFPTCQYGPYSEVIRGIYPSVEEFRKRRNTIEYCIYKNDEGKQYVIYCWNIFSTIHFVQECLKRFGHEDDQFVLIYREKEKKEAMQPKSEEEKVDDEIQASGGFRNPYSSILIESKNIIFRGAPGTGKTHLAREIAADIISNGYFDDLSLLSDEQKKQVEFVQFHPNYDYSDFVEGLRPKVYDDGSVGFELQDGIFKRFVARARKNYEDAIKPQEVIEKEASVERSISDYLSGIELGVDELETISGTKFYLTGVDDNYIHIYIPENKISNKLKLNITDLKKMLSSGQTFSQVKDVTQFFGKLNATQQYSYLLAIFSAIKVNKTPDAKPVANPNKVKPYVFIIDEINRGEISKIFGELFFSIDPGYRGRAGEVSTQYANMHDNPDEKFYVPENVYIIGTMNDIDRSVDSFDFAMRRRFRFIEIKAEDRLEMLDELGEIKDEAIRRMTALNNEISNVEGLNENYHIGAAYFLKLKNLTFDQLWTDYLEPLLQEYVRGMYEEDAIMEKFAKAYGYSGDGNDGA